MCWNVLTVDPNRELGVAAILTGLRFTCYVPTRPVRVRMPHARREPTGRQRHRFVDRALFPRYIFLQVEQVPRWNVLRAIPGLKGYLRTGEAPATVSDAAVDAVREMERQVNDERRNPRKSWPFRAGDHVRIRDQRDPFFGIEGLLEKLDRRDRAVIALMASSGARVIVPASRLEAAE